MATQNGTGLPVVAGYVAPPAPVATPPATPPAAPTTQGGTGNTGGVQPVTSAPNYGSAANGWQSPTATDQSGNPIGTGVNPSAPTGGGNIPGTNTPVAQPQTEAEIQAQMTTEAQAQIDAINKSYAATIAEDQQNAANNQTNVNASAARMGLMGSPTGGSMLTNQANLDQKTIAADQAAQATAIAAVYTNLDNAALQQANLESQQAESDAQTNLAMQQSIAAQAQTQVPALAKTGNTSASIIANDPALWQQLISTTGYSAYQLQALLDTDPNNPNANKTTQTYAADPNDPNSTIVRRIVLDPVTGKSTETDYSIAVPYNQANPNAFQVLNGNLYQQDPNGSGNLILQSPTPISIAQGGSLYDPTTGQIIAQGQSKPTPIPVAGTAAYDAPAVSAKGNATAPATGTTAPVTPAVPGATSGGSSTQGQGSSASIADPVTGAPVSWASLGISGSQVSQLTALGQSPQTVYMQAWAAITGSGTDTTSASSGGGMGSGAAIGKIVSGAVAKAQASIMQAYGLTPADLPAIGAIAGGTTTALATAIPQQSTIQQYISKTSANLNTLQGAIANYNSGDSPIVNEALQALQANVTGNPSYAALNTALTPFLAEYAKVMQGSTGSVSGATVNSQQEAAGILQTSMNKGSFSSAISVMLQDMAGQVNSKNAQILDLTQNLSDVVQQYSKDKGNDVNVPQNNPQQFTVQGQSYYVGDAIPVTDSSGKTTLYQVEADGSLNPY